MPEPFEQTSEPEAEVSAATGVESEQEGGVEGQSAPAEGAAQAEGPAITRAEVEAIKRQLQAGGGDSSPEAVARVVVEAQRKMQEEAQKAQRAQAAMPKLLSKEEIGQLEQGDLFAYMMNLMPHHPAVQQLRDELRSERESRQQIELALYGLRTTEELTRLAQDKPEAARDINEVRAIQQETGLPAETAWHVLLGRRQAQGAVGGQAKPAAPQRAQVMPNPASARPGVSSDAVRPVAMDTSDFVAQELKRQGIG